MVQLMSVSEPRPKIAPPPLKLKLPDRVQFFSASVLLFPMPPPKLVAPLPYNVQALSVATPALNKPPPKMARLLQIVHSFNVTEALVSTRTPPPRFVTEPLVSVRKLRATLPPAISSTRDFPPASIVIPPDKADASM